MAASIINERANTKITKNENWVFFSARIGATGSIKSFAIGGLAILVIALVLREIGDSPQETIVRNLMLFGGLPFALLALLHGVARFRNRLSVSISPTSIEARQTTLFTRTSTWTAIENEEYSVVVIYWDTDRLESIMGMSKGSGKHNYKRVRVGSLYINSLDQRQRLVGKFVGWSALKELADTISASLKLAPPKIVHRDDVEV